MNLAAIHSFLTTNSGKYSFPDGSRVDPHGGSEWYWWRLGVEGICFTLEAALLRATGKPLLPAVDPKDASVEDLLPVARLLPDMTVAERCTLAAFIVNYWSTRPRGLKGAQAVIDIAHSIADDKTLPAEVRKEASRFSSAVQQYTLNAPRRIAELEANSWDGDRDSRARARAALHELLNQ